MLEPQSFRLYILKTLAVVPSRKSYGALKSARTKTEIVTGAANDPPIVVRIGREIEGIVRTVVSGRAQHVIVAVPSLMLMTRIVVRLLPNARRTIVSPAWPKPCCLTGALRKHTVSATFGNVTARESVIGTGIEIVIANVTGPESGTESGTESETAIESGSAIVNAGSETETGRGITARDHDVMMKLQVIMTEREGTAKKSGRDSTAVASSGVLSRSFPTGTSALFLPAVVELRTRRIAVIPGTRR